MKRFIFFLLSLFAVYGMQALAQSYNRNFMLTRTFLNSQGTSCMEQCQYYDDLGRDDQQVQMKITPNGKDLYSAVQYDSIGREWRECVPVVSGTSNGGYLTDIFNRARLSSADQYPFSEIGYESSPLNRVLFNTGAGAAWHETGRQLRSAFFINDSDSTGIFHARHYVVDSNNIFQIASPAVYKEGELHVKLTIDEDNDSTLTFKDKQEKTLLIRRRNGGMSYDTYYIYNDYGLLCYVLPPATEGRTDAATLSLYAYSYRYDHRNRCIEKKLPGCEPVYMIYDRSDRIVLEQNGVQRIACRWTVNKYGSLGRLLYSLEHTDATSVDTLRARVEHLLVFESRLKAVSDTDPFGIGYTDHYLFWGSDRRLLTVNYYDDYSYLNQLDSILKSALSFSSRSGYDGRFGNATGLLTGSRRYLLDNSGNFLVTALYYDRKAQVIQKHSTNVRGGYDHNYSAYTFTGNPLMHFHCHTGISSSTELTEEYIYEYDHANRIIATNYSFNGGERIILSNNSYDEYGRLQKKALHNSVYTSTYTYNIRNWLTGIFGDSFNLCLYYQDGVGIPCYNGNISSLTWQAGMETIERGYRFVYDGIGRLINAMYGEGSTLELNLNRFNEQVTQYDKMGNILNLQRYGQISATEYGLIDNLNLRYKGNQLQSVYDNATHSAYGNGMDFKDDANLEIEYFYDTNGNLTKDLNKNILDIQYNFLNLPRRITFGNGSNISYSYDATGKKLRTVHQAGDVNATTDYCGNVIYENGIAKTILFEGGYISLDDKKYHYFIQDHQGNNRVVVDQNGVIEEVNHYYPFGGTFANSSSVQPYKYNGKELDTKCGLNLYDYGARHYGPVLGRFMIVDPLAEKYYSISPYAYCMGNPVKFVDTDGRKIRLAGNYTGAMVNIAQIAATNSGNQVLSQLISSGDTYTMNSVFWSTSSEYDVGNREINYVGSPSMNTVGGGAWNSMLAMGHETFHAFDHDNHLFNAETAPYSRDVVEPRAVSFANDLARAYSLPSRETYGSLKGDFHQFSGGDKISNFKSLGSNLDKTSLGFSYTKTTTTVVGQRMRTWGIPELIRKTQTSTYYMTVNMDKNKNVTYQIYDNEEEYEKAISNW